MEGELEYIRTESRLDRLAAQLAGTDLLAADTEAAGFHRYLDRICLLQLSTRDATYVVDTLELRDLRPLAGPLEDPTTEVVLHGADFDLRLLQRDCGIRVRGLFDTRIAAQFLGEPALGLADLLEKHCGIRVEKKHQRADWAQRPLPRELLEYAARDTRGLPCLRDRLRAGLQAAGRLAWAEEEFRAQEQVAWVEDNGADAYRRLKGAQLLAPRQLAALRELHAWREEMARRRDLAPFRVITNSVLVDLARQMPGEPETLAKVSGLPRSLIRNHRAELVRLSELVAALPESDLPVRRRGSRPPAPEPEFEQCLERLKKARDEAASGLGLDRGLLMPRAQLEELVRAKPRTLTDLETVPGVRRWQVEALGAALLGAVADLSGRT